MQANILEVKNLKVEFFGDGSQVKAVKGINFQLQRGETLGIVGESGSGKSVTALAVMGLVQHPGMVTEGEIWFSPQENAQPINLSALSPEEMQLYRGGDIAMIFQEPMSSLNPVYDIGFQLTEAIMRHQNVTLPEAEKIAIARLQEVKLLPSDEKIQQIYIDKYSHTPNSPKLGQLVQEHKQGILKRYPHQLSGGQLQRIMIAMAISCNPALLIADEPTTALDVTVQATIIELMRELQQNRQMSMIFISHDLGLIAEVADQVAVMYRGKIVEAGTVEEIFSSPKHPYTKGLIACRPSLKRRAEKLLTVSDYMSVEEVGNDDVVITPKNPEKPLEVSLEVLEQRWQQLSQKRPLLEVRDLYVGFPSQYRGENLALRGRGVAGVAAALKEMVLGGVVGGVIPSHYNMVVNGVSFQVYPGETLGLVGESGCGKTTLGKTLLRLIQPTSGQVIFNGVNISDLKNQEMQQVRRDMQIIFQNPFGALNPKLSVGKAIMEPLQIHGVGETPAARRNRAIELLERVGLDASAMNRYPHQFSGGQRQRICVARALALNPKFIICDESVSALDVSVQAQVLNLLKELQKELQLTYIFISHDLSVVKFMSDRILVMNKGEIVEEGTAESIYLAPQKEYTQKLIAAIPTGSRERKIEL
ncbi:MAG TPA: ABC transporter ATP-binding protein [Nostocaceae cyanobacterium]|nr:ABC transporter ATP-binding protein [Nostocaceae cyanobacterium]